MVGVWSCTHFNFFSEKVESYTYLFNIVLALANKMWIVKLHEFFCIILTKL